MSRVQNDHAVEMAPPPQEPKQPEGATHLSPPSSPPPPPHHSPEPKKARLLLGWEGNKHDTLLVVATLITALTYQLGTNIPGGYWQDDGNGHRAGDPIMRDMHRKRYWLFMAASWVGFVSSMLMTVSLLTGVSVNSRRVRWPFVLAYSSLMLTFITSQPRTSLAMDLALWAGLLTFLSVVVNLKSRSLLATLEAPCRSGGREASTRCLIPLQATPLER